MTQSSDWCNPCCNTPGFLMGCCKTWHLKQAALVRLVVLRKGTGVLGLILGSHLHSAGIGSHFVHCRSLWKQIQVFHSRLMQHSTGYLDLVKYRMDSGYLKCCAFFPQLQFLGLLYTYSSAPSLLLFASIFHYQLLLLADTNPASKLSSSREDNCFKEIQFTVSSTSKEDLRPGEVTDLGNQIKSPVT